MNGRVFRLGILACSLGLFAHGPAQAQCVIGNEPGCPTAAETPRPSPIKAANEPQTTGSVPAHRNRRLVHNIVELHQRIRACWVPPSPRESWEGMEYTIAVSFKRDGDVLGPAHITYASPEAPMWARQAFRDAVGLLFARCTPMPFSEDFGAAIAGRLIRYRFVDPRRP